MLMVPNPILAHEDLRDARQREEAEIFRRSHQEQIAALCDTYPGTDEDRLRRFGKAARWDEFQLDSALTCLMNSNASVTYAAWAIGTARYSLFADLPGCHCPVVENTEAERSGDDLPFPGLPALPLGRRWDPSREVLAQFSRVQLRERGLD